MSAKVRVEDWPAPTVKGWSGRFIFPRTKLEALLFEGLNGLLPISTDKPGLLNHINERLIMSDTYSDFIASLAPRSTRARDPSARYPKLSFRLSPAELTAIRDAAATAGVTVSDYIRLSLRLASKPSRRRVQARAIQRALETDF